MSIRDVKSLWMIGYELAYSIERMLAYVDASSKKKFSKMYPEMQLEILKALVKFGKTFCDYKRAWRVVLIGLKKDGLRISADPIKEPDKFYKEVEEVLQVVKKLIQ